LAAVWLVAYFWGFGGSDVPDPGPVGLLIYTNRRLGEAENPGPRPRREAPSRIGIDLERPVISLVEKALRDRCVGLFDDWLARRFCGLATSQICTNGALLSRLLREFGKEFFAQQGSEREFREAILGIRDRYQDLRWTLGGAWELAERWSLHEPGKARTVLSKRVMQAMVSIALLWKWYRFAGLLLCGFTCPFHPSELYAIKKIDLVLPSDQLEEGEGAELYIRILEPKTRFRGPRRQHGAVDDPLVIAYMEALFGGASPEEPVFPPGKNAFRNRWDKVCVKLGITPRDIPSGAVPAVIRGSAATQLFKQTKSIPLTMWRGRWQVQKTLEYYLQETGGHSFLALQSPATRENISIAAAAAGGLIRAAMVDITLRR